MADIVIAGRPVGPGHPTYVIAELSANHGGRLERAEDLVRAAAEAGADAAKVQTYTPDSMTLDSQEAPFRVAEGLLWTGRTLYELYEEAQTPWEWYPRLRDVAQEVGIDLFSSPFDRAAVAFLDGLDVPVLKIASFELVDLDLIGSAAATGRPLIMSTGMATVEEIDEAVATATQAGASGIVLLRCNSAYPAPASEMDLRTIPDMVLRWGVPVGLSDHTIGSAAAVAAVALGAVALEKHLTISRDEPTADAAFSLEPHEFQAMVNDVREAEAALGGVRYGPSERERDSARYRRSLFIVADVAEGEELTQENVRSIRPGDGLAPRHLPAVLGRRAGRPLARGTPLAWTDLAEER
jgi:N-acetylneuraminate synthase